MGIGQLYSVSKDSNMAAVKPGRVIYGACKLKVKDRLSPNFSPSLLFSPFAILVVLTIPAVYGDSVLEEKTIVGLIMQLACKVFSI